MENFCKYFAEDKPRYTLEEIARKREKVIEMVEKKVGKRITLANIRDVMTPALMMDIIDKNTQCSNLKMKMLLFQLF